MRPILVLLLAALPLAGCLDSIGDRFTNDPDPVAPAAVTFKGTVGPGFNKNESFSVPVGMAEIVVDVNLTMTGSPNPAFPAIAQVDFTLTGPSGEPQKKTLSPQKLTDTLTVSSPAAGAWVLNIKGNGLGGQGMGATYGATVNYRV